MSGNASRAAALKRKDMKIADKYKEICPPHRLGDLEQLVKSLKGNEEAIQRTIMEWWEVEQDQPVENEWNEIHRKKPAAAPKPVNRGNRRGQRNNDRGDRDRRDDKGDRKQQRDRGHRNNQTRDTHKKEKLPVVQPPRPQNGVPTTIVTTPTLVEQPAVVEPVDPPVAQVVSGGNVWATKGAAHIIQAENKPKPVPVPVETVKAEKSTRSRRSKAQQQEVQPVVEETDTVEEVATEILSDPAAPTAEPASTPWETSPMTPVDSEMIQDTTLIAPPPVTVEEPTLPEVVAAEPVTAPVSSNAGVLKLGRWDASDVTESNSFDFVFGGDGDASEATEDTPKVEATVESTSPARPPPGLSIGGMPPIPANAVLVHELENKLEQASITQSEAKPAEITPQDKAVEVDANVAKTAPVSMAQTAAEASHTAARTQLHQPPYGAAAYGGAYGMNQMYGNGFMGANNFGVAAAPNTGASQSDGEKKDEGDTANRTGVASLPPGMQGAPGMAYNPALYYPQPAQYQMGQPHGGVGYGYGYGQYGGGMQGYGYQQVMGQQGGYGQGPHYDESNNRNHNNHHRGNQGGYGKGSGYRGNKNYHNQYQNQYNPQMMGYGAQPYNMGYGGYGNMDPYNMPQQNYNQGGVGNNDHNNNNRGKFGSNPDFQIQQGQPQQPPQTQQSFPGLDSASTDRNSPNVTGWNNNTNNSTNSWNAPMPGSSWQGS